MTTSFRCPECDTPWYQGHALGCSQPEVEEPPPTRPINDETGYVGRNHPDTAHAMQRKALGRSGTMRRAVYDRLAERPSTDYELEDYFGGAHQSVSGCRSTLKKDGWVVATDETRRNRFGNDAIVWTVRPEDEH